MTTQKGHKPRAVIITTAPQTIATFFAQQVRDLRSAGFEMQAISSPGAELETCRAELEIPLHAIAMQRSISPLKDCAAIWRLTRVLRDIKPDIVQTHTPKAGLLGMIAAAGAGVPIRIYTVNGLVWESMAGWRGALLRSADRIAALLATRILCVSDSVRAALLARHICARAKAEVLGRGGSHGVDLQAFDPERFTGEDRARIRERYKLADDALVVGFVGRFVRDKGFETLLDAWAEVRESLPHARLLLAGDRESSHPISESVWAKVTNDARIAVTRALPGQMPEIYSIMDILVLPTFREGLPNVLLEAGAMRVPVVATRATGCVDVVREGETGLLTSVGATTELAAALLTMASSSEVRRAFGEEGRRRIAADFSEAAVSSRLIDEYRRLLSERRV